jgi:hypothetical protein
MPNLNNPNGLRSLGITLSGVSPTTNLYVKLAAYATALFRGDAVNRVASGPIEVSATPGTTTYQGVNLNFGAASTATDHIVVDDPNALFTAQMSLALAAADIGKNANLLLSAGNAATKQSRHAVNSTGIAATATLDVKLLRLLSDPTNELGDYGRVVLVFNKHRMNPGVLGV